MDQREPKTNPGAIIEARRIDLPGRLRFIFERYVTYETDGELNLDRNDYPEELEKDLRFKAEARAITKFYKSLTEFQDYIKKNYKKQLWLRGVSYP